MFSFCPICQFFNGSRFLTGSVSVLRGPPVAMRVSYCTGLCGDRCGQAWHLGAGEASCAGSARGGLRSSLLAMRGSQFHPSAFPAAFPPRAPPSATKQRGCTLRCGRLVVPEKGGTLGRCLPQAAAPSCRNPRVRAALWWWRPVFRSAVLFCTQLGVNCILTYFCYECT